MNAGEVKIISEMREGLRACAASARISTTQSGALDCFERSDGGDKDIKLIKKVLASGHKTIIEHQAFTLAFSDVSVLVEQFVIEFRLASYTVKSRRYVDFSDAGFVTPAGLPADINAAYARHMRARFESYAKLLALGVPREDARFVLPYSFRSNFYATLNARELAHMTEQMIYGRGSAHPEIYALGLSLKAQLDARLPGALKGAEEFVNSAEADTEIMIADARRAQSLVELVSAPTNPEDILALALKFSGRFDTSDEGALKRLARDGRARELELLNYAFRVNNLSLACLTHFTRHRMLSLITKSPLDALAGGLYVIPDTVKSNPEALEIYSGAFAQNARDAREAKQMGLDGAPLAYYALAGHMTDIIVSMNARELMHFMRLRVCARAQWEIRAIAQNMLCALMENCPRLFRYFGPSCAVLGYCPEGRLSCNKSIRPEE